MDAVEAAPRRGRPPRTRVDDGELTGRQSAIVDFIEREVARQGYSPEDGGAETMDTCVVSSAGVCAARSAILLLHA